MPQRTDPWVTRQHYKSARWRSSTYNALMVTTWGTLCMVWISLKWLLLILCHWVVLLLLHLIIVMLMLRPRRSRYVIPRTRRR